MSSLFHLILTQPLFNLLVVLYKYVTFGDLGLAIVMLTVVVRVILYPVFYKGLKSQTMMQKIQPEVARIQRDLKNDKEAQARALMALYKENKVNPFSSMIYIFAQLPILIAVYRIFMEGLTTETFKNLYPFIAAPITVNHEFIGLIDITKPSMIIVVLAAVAQYAQAKMSMAKSGSGSSMTKYMVFMGPLLTLLILPKLSAGIGIYWLTTSIFSIFQQHLINKQLAKTNS